MIHVRIVHLNDWLWLIMMCSTTVMSRSTTNTLTDATPTPEGLMCGGMLLDLLW